MIGAHLVGCHFQVTQPLDIGRVVTCHHDAIPHSSSQSLQWCDLSCGKAVQKQKRLRFTNISWHKYLKTHRKHKDMYKHIYIYLLSLLPSFFWVEDVKPGFFRNRQKNLGFSEIPCFPEIIMFWNHYIRVQLILKED